MTVDPTRIECDFCGNDTRGGRSHEHFDTYSDGQVRHVVTSLCCGCECARERAELARARKAETEALREALRDAVVEQCRAEHEAGVEAIADRIERRMGGVA